MDFFNFSKWYNFSVFVLKHLYCFYTYIHTHTQK